MSTTERPGMILYKPFFLRAALDAELQPTIISMSLASMTETIIRQNIANRMTQVARHTPFTLTGNAIDTWKGGSRIMPVPVLTSICRIYGTEGHLNDLIVLHNPTITGDARIRRIYTPAAAIVTAVLTARIAYFRDFMTVSLDEYGTVHVGGAP